MTNLNLEIIDAMTTERHYTFDLDFEYVMELIKTRNEDEDLVIEQENETIVIPVCLMDKSIVYVFCEQDK